MGWFRRFLPSLLLLGLLGLLVSFPLSAADSQCVWTGIEKVVAIGDLHGDYDHFVKILRGTRLVDGDLHWTGDKTHLVQMGDIMDRGDEARKILGLLRKLETEAAAAGGQIHVILGNHEEMNITGFVFNFQDYVTVPQFVSFLPDKYRRDKEKEFGKKNGGRGDINAFWEALMKEQEAKDVYTENFNLLYGRWLTDQSAVIKINDVVFVHGGINEFYSKMKLEEINALYHDEFKKSFRGDIFRPKILFAEDGPLWNRDLAAQADEAQIDQILANLGAKHIIVAHTPVLVWENMSRFGGKVWIVDTGISSVYGGHLSALIIEGEHFAVWGKE
ncbi:MAG: metallophosphoesterase [Candidatus Aminicenantales bacterium]